MEVKHAVLGYNEYNEYCIMRYKARNGKVRRWPGCEGRGGEVKIWESRISETTPSYLLMDLRIFS